MLTVPNPSSTASTSISTSTFGHASPLRHCPHSPSPASRSSATRYLQLYDALSAHTRRYTSTSSRMRRGVSSRSCRRTRWSRVRTVLDDGAGGERAAEWEVGRGIQETDKAARWREMGLELGGLWPWAKHVAEDAAVTRHTTTLTDRTLPHLPVGRAQQDMEDEHGARHYCER